MRPKTAQSVAVSGTAAAASAIGAHIDTVRLFLTGATADAYYVLTGTATTSGFHLPKDVPYDITVPEGAVISVIGTDGALKITEFTR